MNWRIRRAYDFIKDFIPHFKRACKYFKIMWESEDFDSMYLLRLEQEKLKDMYNYFKDAKWTATEWVHARDCKLAIALLDIILDDDSSIEFIFDHGNPAAMNYVIRKWVNDENMHRFMNQDMCKEYRILTSKKNLRPQQSQKAAIYRDELRKAKAWNLYCKLREYSLLEWSD